MVIFWNYTVNIGDLLGLEKFLEMFSTSSLKQSMRAITTLRKEPH